MKLGTIHTRAGTRAVRVEDDVAIELGPGDLVDVLADARWRETSAVADGPRHALADVRPAPVVLRPGKIVCVGHNYAAHIAEMGRQRPEYPTLFAKYADSLIGALDPLALPAASECVDWEAELAVVVGSPLRNAGPDEARDAIAGYTVANDVTARDWQTRTVQWLQGKTFEATTPVGPWLVTDAVPGRITCSVSGELVQEGDTTDLVFDPPTLLSYISRIITVRPGDLVLTGTPGGVGHARTPPRYLAAGDVLVTAVDGVGECRNAVVVEEAA